MARRLDFSPLLKFLQGSPEIVYSECENDYSRQFQSPSCADSAISHLMALFYRQRLYCQRLDDTFSDNAICGDACKQKPKTFKLLIDKP
jgi:hypothetical protein